MKEFNFAGDSDDLCTINNKCAHCGEDNKIILDYMSYLRWYDGEGFIQDIFPKLSSQERELIISGTHPECWIEIFGKEDE